MKTTNKFLLVLLTVFIIIFTISCNKDDNVVAVPPTVMTAEVIDIDKTSATCGGTVTSDGNDEVTVRGVCWSTDQTPVISDDRTRDGSGTGTYTSSITGLYCNTTYYVRGYAINGEGTGYGNTVSFTTEEEIVEPITDIDGNVYNIVVIGSQVWMAENLKVTHYWNGDVIPHVADYDEWRELTEGAYCNYANDPIIASFYGHLYNFDAVIDSRNICPEGWHIPSRYEWETLIDYLGGESVAGGKLKSFTSWEHNGNGTNESGFSALPAGIRNSNYENYIWLGENTYFWSSTSMGDYAYSFGLFYFDSEIHTSTSGNLQGYSIRCIRD